MSELYRPDVGQVYRKYRPNIASFYPIWFSSYEEIARRNHIQFSSVTTLPHELENHTLSETTSIAYYHPFKMAVLMGPLCSGKSLIKDHLKRKGIPTIPDYITRNPRLNEIDGDEYKFVSNSELIALYQAGSLVYINDHIHSNMETPYKSGFPKDPFVDLVEADSPFFITKTFGGWSKLEDFLQKQGTNNELLERRLVNIFLLPPAPHVLVLRAIQRTLNNFVVPVFSELSSDVELRIMAEFDRSIASPNILTQSLNLRRIVYLVNDDPDRVTSRILTLLGK